MEIIDGVSHVLDGDVGYGAVGSWFDDVQVGDGGRPEAMDAVAEEADGGGRGAGGEVEDAVVEGDDELGFGEGSDDLGEGVCAAEVLDGGFLDEAGLGVGTFPEFGLIGGFGSEEANGESLGVEGAGEGDPVDYGPEFFGEGGGCGEEDLGDGRVFGVICGVVLGEVVGGGGAGEVEGGEEDVGDEGGVEGRVASLEVGVGPAGVVPDCSGLVWGVGEVSSAVGGDAGAGDDAISSGEDGGEGLGGGGVFEVDDEIVGGEGEGLGDGLAGVGAVGEEDLVEPGAAGGDLLDAGSGEGVESGSWVGLAEGLGDGG